jgi:hypothetical protein
VKTKDWLSLAIVATGWIASVTLLIAGLVKLDEERASVVRSLEHNAESIEKIENLLNLHGYYLHEVE